MPACAHLLSNHLQRHAHSITDNSSAASKTGGKIIPFIVYACGVMLTSFVEQGIQVIRDEQLNLFWAGGKVRQTLEILKQANAADTWSKSYLYPQSAEE